MSTSPLKKFVLTPALISASVFAALSLPLAVLGSKPITIQLQQETVFYGKLRDVAIPYLGFIGTISVGAGVASVAIAGWQQTKRKSEEIEADLSALAQELKQKEAQLEALKLSEARLEASGLKAFLDEDVPSKPDRVHQSSQHPELKAFLDEDVPSEPQQLALPPSSNAQPVVEVVEDFVMTPHTFKHRAATSPATEHTLTTKFAYAQTILGYAQIKATPQPPIGASEQPMSGLPNKEMEQLQTQLQEMKAQMALLQEFLGATARTSKPEVNVLTNAAPMYVVNSWTAHKRISRQVV